MKKSVKCTVLCLIMVCCMVFSLPLTASAVDNYFLPCNEPAMGINQGYINILFRTSSGVLNVHTWSWTLLPIYTDDSVTYNATEMMIDISDDVISFFGRSHGNYQLSSGFSRVQSGENNRSMYFSSYSNSSSSELYSFDYGTSTILGYQIYGNGVLESSDISSSSNKVFSVTWGDDSKSVSLMTEIISELRVLAQNDTKILAKLESILADTSNIDATLLRLEDLLEQLLDAKGESTFEEPSTESISDYNKAEDELVSGADDTSDIEQQIEDFEIDADSSSLIWSIIQGYLNQNELVFGLVVGVLCLGIIALILNR